MYKYTVFASIPGVPNYSCPIDKGGREKNGEKTEGVEETNRRTSKQEKEISNVQSDPRRRVGGKNNYSNDK